MIFSKLMYKEIWEEIASMSLDAEKLSQLVITNNENSYFLKSRFVNKAKSNIIRRKSLIAYFLFHLSNLVIASKNWLSFICIGTVIEVPAQKNIFGKFSITRNIKRTTPPLFSEAKDIAILKKRIRPSIKEILKVCNLCIKSKVKSPSLHAYYLYVLSNYDLKNAYFVWEDAGSNINRIFCDITRVYGKGSEGYISAEITPKGLVLNTLMCCPIITNNYKNFHRASQVIRKGWLSYTKYESNCFSKHFSLKVLEKFSCGIILPFFSPHLPEGISFIKQIKKMKFISESNVLVSAHPQSGNIWDEYINDQKLWTK